MPPSSTAVISGACARSTYSDRERESGRRSTFFSGSSTRFLKYALASWIQDLNAGEQMELRPLFHGPF